MAPLIYVHAVYAAVISDTPPSPLNLFVCVCVCFFYFDSRLFSAYNIISSEIYRHPSRVLYIIPSLARSPRHDREVFFVAPPSQPSSCHFGDRLQERAPLGSIIIYYDRRRAEFEYGFATARGDNIIT